MRVLARLVLVWLIALALPIQGVAGATMLHCAPSHHQAGAQASPAADGPAHHHPAQRAAPAAHAVHGDGGLAHGHHAGDKSGCSACAACCAAAALAVPVTPLVPLLRETQQSPAAAGDVRPAAFITGGPERPPRPFRA